MQQGRVIRVFQVLLIEFPVARQDVAVNAQQPEFRPVKCGVELGADFRAEIILDGFHIVACGRKYDAAPRCDMEPAQTELRHVEIFRRATFSIYAAPERDGGQIAFQVVGPVVVRADEAVCAAPIFAAKFDAPMGAAVLEDVQLAINVAGHDHWIRADIGPYVIAWFRYFAFEPDVIPVAAKKNLLDFALVDVLIGVDPVGYARFVSRPLAVGTSMPSALLSACCRRPSFVLR